MHPESRFKRKQGVKKLDGTWEAADLRFGLKAEVASVLACKPDSSEGNSLMGDKNNVAITRGC